MDKIKTLLSKTVSICTTGTFGTEDSGMGGQSAIYNRLYDLLPSDLFWV